MKQSIMRQTVALLAPTHRQIHGQMKIRVNAAMRAGQKQENSRLVHWNSVLYVGGNIGVQQGVVRVQNIGFARKILRGHLGKVECPF